MNPKLEAMTVTCCLLLIDASADDVILNYIFKKLQYLRKRGDAVRAKAL